MYDLIKLDEVKIDEDQLGLRNGDKRFSRYKDHNGNKVSLIALLNPRQTSYT